MSYRAHAQLLVECYAFRAAKPGRLRVWENAIRETRAKLKRMSRDRLADRAKLAARVHACTEDGVVAVAYDSMDCDCMRSTGSFLMPPVPRAVENRIDLEYEGVEGPTSVWICKPSEAPDRESRDLAMEAFEDGHPHVVYL